MKIILSFLLICSFVGGFAQKDDDPYKTIILGGGVGAMTSAIYLARAGYHPVIIEGENPGGTITLSHIVENWPGETKVSGEELAKKIREQAENWGVKFLSEKAVLVNFHQHPFVIETQNVDDETQRHTYTANSCIIAMGSTPRFLDIPGEKEFWGRGVSNCAICDGTLYKDKIVAVIGGGDSAVIEADYLSKLAKQVYIILRKDRFRSIEKSRLDILLKKPNISVRYNTMVENILGDDKGVSHLLVSGEKDNNQVAVDGIFLAIGATPNSKIFTRQLALTKEGYIQLTEGQKTSVDGVFAIGDIADPYYKQAISAAGDGAKAAMQAEKFLTSFRQEVSPTEVGNDSQFDEMLQSTNKPVIIKFYSKRCRPCRTLTPYYDQACSQFSHKMRFVQINVARHPTLSDRYDIRAVPTVIVLSEKKEIERYSGFDRIKNYLNSLKK